MDALTIAIVAGSILICVLVMVWFMRSYGGAMGGIKNGIPAAGVIQSVQETGVTISTPSIGPEAPVYKVGLLVTPPGGGDPYPVVMQHAFPRVFLPMIVPGARIGVQIDRADPQKVAPDFQRFTNPDGDMGASLAASLAGAGASGAPIPAESDVPMTAGGVLSTAGVPVTFDAQGHPTSGLDDLVSGVRSGRVPQIKGKAATLLATGTHGTAVVTSCQPLGMRVRDLDPAAEPSHLDDPMWLFTVEVTLAGRAPFTSMFGHRVPAAKVGEIGPGTKLAVAVDERQPSVECAIDWDRSPLPA